MDLSPNFSFFFFWVNYIYFFNHISQKDILSSLVCRVVQRWACIRCLLVGGRSCAKAFLRRLQVDLRSDGRRVLGIYGQNIHRAAADLAHWPKSFAQQREWTFGAVAGARLPFVRERNSTLTRACFCRTKPRPWTISLTITVRAEQNAQRMSGLINNMAIYVSMWNALKYPARHFVLEFDSWPEEYAFWVQYQQNYSNRSTVPNNL